ncbi:hypothetical protein [Streptomyces albidoflavus]|uniref:hypothetical protein n=1 Tax=Streptomyces albidoflavus TaxID=1886 RepID=UPI0010201A92|nr:hypothetical protein [Streptomyces albidoflavus]RZF05996.1 hypothetical protein C0R05_24495 [Streptomyces albidoflavus]
MKLINVYGRCHRCQQPRAVFAADASWGQVPSPLCSPCWSKYADARASRSYVDFNDAFDNASDDELGAWIAPAKEAP